MKEKKQGWLMLQNINPISISVVTPLLETNEYLITIPVFRSLWDKYIDKIT